MSFVVTIDGPSAAGKSTAARTLASRLGFLYVDTGALYRAVALKMQWSGASPDDPAAVERCLAGTALDLSGSPEQPHVWLDGADVSGEIRTPAVSEMSSRIAALPAVRRKLVEIQRALRARGPLVAEGRDLGTVVFPDAEVKIFLDADLATRARRRARELEQRGIPVPLEQVSEELERRDRRDRSRADSPLRPADGAVVVDCSTMDVDGVVAEVLRVVRAHHAWPGGGAPAAGRGG
ncbi:MAG: (d)CMP kinase [Candidatus Eisenbacteria bacterium]|nr:(d)CMP kinase [Candidatus Eisenbacteria bacterium]